MEESHVHCASFEGKVVRMSEQDLDAPSITMEHNGLATAFDQHLLEGVEKMYSTAEAAAFFGKSNQWLYWGMRNKIFVDANGSLIEPIRIGEGRRRRFTLPCIREIALSCYRRGNLKEDGLKEVFRKILIAEYGENAFEQPEVVEG